MTEVLVVGSETYTGTQTNMNTALSVTITGVTLVATADNTVAGAFARTWAVTNGVAFIHVAPIIAAAGYDTIKAPQAAANFVTPTNILTAGTHARVTAASGHATTHNLNLNQI